MIQLASGLGMTALAEGIETPGELEFLRAHGCPLGQGFHFARPVPAEEDPGAGHPRGRADADRRRALIATSRKGTVSLR